MMRYLSVFSAALLLLLCGCDNSSAGSGTDASGGQKSAVGEVSFMPVCPPKNCPTCNGNGESYALSFDLPQPGRHFEMTIWGRGMTAFRNNESFSTDGKLGGDGTGAAFIIEGRGDGMDQTPTPQDVKATLSPPASGRYDGTGSWTLVIEPSDKGGQELTYFINPHISMLTPVCD